MPRPRRTQAYRSVIEPLSVIELKNLKTEIDAEIKYRKKEEQRASTIQNIIKTRDKLKIGQKITYKQRASDKEVISAEVTAIFPDKVQIEINGRKRSVSLAKVL